MKALEHPCNRSCVPVKQSRPAPKMLFGLPKRLTLLQDWASVSRRAEPVREAGQPLGKGPYGIKFRGLFS